MTAAAFTLSVQEPDFLSLAGHVLANAQQGAAKHIMLTYQHALLPLVINASTEQITDDVVHARVAVVLSLQIRETQDQAQHKLQLL